nr:hypothetical protein [Fodinibius sp.]NIV09780.1 hypothetical protein [Fodinibius sp.]NIY23306.1 hypothetical protein [Fodinibius sp.]
HDEIVLEAPDDELTQVVPLVHQVMAQAYQLSVPLKVNIEIGQNWLELESYQYQTAN